MFYDIEKPNEFCKDISKILNNDFSNIINKLSKVRGRVRYCT